MTTAQDLINSAYRLVVELSEGETPSTQASTDMLAVLNTLLDGWSAERLAVFATQDQQFTWTATSISNTLGPSGTFVGNRPVVLDDATYFKDPSTGISYGLKIINQQQYDGIAVKTVTSTYPQVIFCNDKFPNMEMFVYPVPTKDLEFHFISVQELSEPATLSTVITFPPGYLRALKYNLAKEIAAEFGTSLRPEVAQIALEAKRAIKRNNNPNDIMSIPYSIVGSRQRFNVYSGNY